MDQDGASSSSPSSSSASISITPLAGSQTSSRALCHLLEFDDAKILLDCGINDTKEEFTYDDFKQDRIDYLEKLKELAPQLTLVLLSAPTVETLGLLPYLVAKLRLACPIYATFPCRTLGQVTLEEWVTSRAEEESQDVPIPSTPANPKSPARPGTPGSGQPERADDVAWRVTKEEIQLSFSRISPVVYSQVIRLAGRSNSPFSLLAHPSGSYLGGTLWSLRSATTDSLLYSPFFNHVNERTLDLAAFMIKGKDGRNEVNEAMRRVGVLVIGAERSLITATKAKERDRALLDLINTTLQSNASILMPTDSIGRFIELLVLLEQHWAFSNLSQRFPLCLLSKHGEEILFTIRRLEDSLGGQMGKDEGERERVLRFRNVRIIESPEQLKTRYPANQPKLIICAPSSLAYGYSRDVLASTFLDTPNSLVLLTTPGQSGSLSSHLFNLWNDRQPAATRYGSGKVGQVIDFNANDSSGAITSSTKIRLKMRKKVVLQGEELMTFLEEQRVNKEKEQKAKAMAERNRRMMEADDDDGSSDSDSSDEEGGDEAAKEKLAQAIKDGEAGQGAGIGAASYAEPGSGPATRSGKKGVAKYGLEGGVATSGGGAWDEFLDDTKSSQMGGFDIFVRHHANVLGANSTAQNASNIANQTRYKMFPFFERRRKIDGYGEVIDIEGWKTRGKAPEEVEAVLAGPDTALGKRKRQEEEEAARQEPPHKFVTEDITMPVRCKVLAIDMEGKADGRALRSILPLIEPKKLVLINGDVEATQDLTEALSSTALTAENIFSPSVGEATKIADVTKSFSLRLDDSLMTALALRKVDEYEVVPIRGVIGQSDESTVPVLIPSTSINPTSDTNGHESSDTNMDDSDSLPCLQAPHFVGDIKLALLKNNLTAKNVPVAFHKGSLICGPYKPATAAAKAKDPKISRIAKLTGASRPSPTPEQEDESIDTSGGKVTVRKEGGQLVLEGAPGDTFYAVREAVYLLHAVAT